MYPSKSYLVGAEKLCYPENAETLGDQVSNLLYMQLASYLASVTQMRLKIVVFSYQEYFANSNGFNIYDRHNKS